MTPEERESLDLRHARSRAQHEVGRPDRQGRREVPLAASRPGGAGGDLRHVAARPRRRRHRRRGRRGARWWRRRPVQRTAMVPSPDTNGDADAADQEDPLPSIDFATFILSLSHSALMHLGEAPHPETDKVAGEPPAREAKHRSCSVCSKRRRKETSPGTRSVSLRRCSSTLGCATWSARRSAPK